MRARHLIAAAVLLTIAPSAAAAQDAPAESGLTKVIDAVGGLFKHPIKPSLESVAPTGGLTGGIAFAPREWKTEDVLTQVGARASISIKKYWAVDGSASWQSLHNRWRVETYGRARSMRELPFFGPGNGSLEADRASFSLLERRVGAYAWRRPVPWLAIGARAEGLWPRASAGHGRDWPSVETRFPAEALPGFGDTTGYVHVQAFANLNYPNINEPSRRGGDYQVLFSRYAHVTGDAASFNRFQVEGQERFTVFGRDRALTIHGLVSTSMPDAGSVVPFHLMDTLGGADNLRGFRDDIIGSDQTKSTLRAFESFRFRDANSVLLQVELRQRVWSQLWLGVFVDAGMVAPKPGDLGLEDLHRGAGVSIGVFRTNQLAIRADFSLVGGEGHQHFLTTNKYLGF